MIGDDDDTAPGRPRPPLPPERLDELRCAGCRQIFGHRADCTIEAARVLAAIQRAEMRMHANRHWVRAVTVAAAERTQRGIADVHFVLAVHEGDSWRTDGAP